MHKCSSCGSDPIPNIADLKETGVQLGRGAYGVVKEIDWNGTLCAAKKVHDIFLELPSGEEKEAIMNAFKNECRTWSKLIHPNVVQFLGLYQDGSSANSAPVLILEKMDTSLTKYLEVYTKSQFPLSQKLFIFHQVAQALAYLHTRTPPLVHHDLTPNNILVSYGSLIAKVTDFGMTHALDPKNLTRKSSIKGTWVFMGPEALSEDLKSDEKLDIFSYGNVVITTVTHEWPNPRLAVEHVEDVLTPRTEYQRRQRQLVLFTAQEEELLVPTIRECLDNRPSKRPSSLTIIERVVSMRKMLDTQPDGITCEMEIAALRKQLSQTEKELLEKCKECAQLKEDAFLQVDEKTKQFDNVSKQLDDVVQQRDHAIKQLEDTVQQLDDMQIEKRGLQQELEDKEAKLVDIQIRFGELPEKTNEKGFPLQVDGLGQQQGNPQLKRKARSRSVRKASSEEVYSRNWTEVGTCRRILKHRPGTKYEAIAVRDNLLAVTDDNHQVHLVTTEGETIRSFGEDRLSCKLHGVTFNKDGDVFVCDTGNKTVLLYSQEGEVLSTIQKGKEGCKSPAGIVVSPSQYIYICDQKQHHISVHNKLQEGGRCMFTIGDKGDGDGRFNSPRDIAIFRPTMMYFVCDTNNGRISVCTREGKFVMMFKTKYPPTCIAADACGHLIITSSEAHAVMVYTAKGELVTEFGKLGDQSGEFNTPTGVTVDNKGNIYVCDTGNERIQIF